MLGTVPKKEGTLRLATSRLDDTRTEAGSYKHPSLQHLPTENTMHDTMAAVCFVSYVAGKNSCAKDADGPPAGQGCGLAMRKLCAADGGGAAKSLLLPGASPEHRAEVCATALAVWLTAASAWCSCA